MMRPINVTEPTPVSRKGYDLFGAPIWMLAFRPLFLGGSLVALLGISYWTLLLTGHVAWSLSIPANVWHAHEMMYGFAAAIAMGFLLTAAQTWTGVPSLSGKYLMLLSFFWLLARILFFVKFPHNSLMDHNTNLFLVVLFQGMWWLGGIFALSRMLIKARNKQNYLFIGILTTLFIFNMLFLFLVLNQQSVLALKLCDASIFVFTLLMGIVAGRVIPFFTARGLLLPKQVKCPRLDFCIWILTLWVLICVIGQSFYSIDMASGISIAVLSACHLLRSVFWWCKEIIKVPLLWSLQLSYFLLGIGLILIALSFITTHIDYKNALHMVTIGSMGMMILSMMSRVSLGHTGRALNPPYFMNVAFLCLFLAAITRSLLPSLIGAQYAWLSSGVLWSLSFFLFLFHYFPILIKKRVDGRIG
ncbi:NnrS family protein [uncultured Shewanella sp.]|uniref:NnrS family protein n=1 Tax=uncultured Shewanella sp. TaxID=173975 RepID=UPI00260F7816|nr:NnrS family protein [uncultured Shewanella sp.]